MNLPFINEDIFESYKRVQFKEENLIICNIDVKQFFMFFDCKVGEWIIINIVYEE